MGLPVLADGTGVQNQWDAVRLAGLPREKVISRESQAD